MIARLPVALAATLAWGPPAAPVQDPPQLDFQQGTIAIGGQLATTDLPDGWTYLGTRDARYILEQVWGNPPGTDALGLIWPDTAMVEGEGLDPSSWAVVVSYDDSGRVGDDDAAEIDYDDLLASMQDETRAESKERQKAGYGAIELVGWAEAPHYDPAQKRLYWAQLLSFGEGSTTLNYNVRILGREGVLVMNAVAEPGELAQVAAGCKQLLAATHFQAGHRYEDFDPSTDRVAAYGIGGLIAGKVLAKAGLFKVLLAFLAKGWKVLVLLVVGGLSAARRIFGGKPQPARRSLASGRAVEQAEDDDEEALEGAEEE